MGSTEVTEIDEILHATGLHFSELLNANANPLEAALALMDTSSIGKAKYAREFEQLQAELNNCLKKQVGNNYQGFNSSISVYHTLVNLVNDNHQTVQGLQEELEQVRELVKKRRPVMKEWQATTLRYKESLKLLDIAEGLKQVPDKFEEFISRKRFLEAHKCLNDALEKMVSHNMLQYSSISPIHSYVVQQQLGLAQTMAHELKSHIYLQSPWTESRWINYSVPQDSEDLIQIRIQHEQATLANSAHLHSFLEKLKEPLDTDHSSSIESDSFIYIRLLVDILGKTDRLDQVAESIISNVSTDVRRLVERTISDFIKKEKISVESLASLPSDTLAQLECPEYHQRLCVLEALVSTIYSKLNAVLESHRVFYELVKGRVQYELFRVYMAVENEVSSLLSSYINAMPTRTRRKSFGSESRRSAPSKHHTKSEFVAPAFQYMPETMDAEIQSQFDQLRLSMKKWVPGLELTADMDNGSFNPYADTHKESNLSVVAPANVFNIKALAAPTASFLQNAGRTLNGEEKCIQRIENFMSDLLNNSYLPTLKQNVEKFMDDILEEESVTIYSDYSHESQYPIMDSAFKTVDLVSKLSSMLNTNTYYRPNYVDILLTIFEQSRDYVSAKIKDGLSGRHNRPKAIQQLNSQQVVKDLHRKLRSDYSVSEDELNIYLKLVSSGTNSANRLTLNDLLDIDTFKLFTLLSTTIQWVVQRLRKFGKVREQSSEPSTTSMLDSQVTYVRRWWALVDVGVDASPNSHILLSGESVQRFEKVLEHFEAYNRQILSLLRCDLMCRIVYHFDEMALKGTFDSPTETEEHDSDIELLQTNIATCHKLTAKYLLPSDRKFVFAGCARLMNELFILESKNIKGLINENGVRKMFSNILSLQQVLKSVVSEPRDVDFLRAVEFYEAMRATAARAINSARSQKSKLTESDLVLLLQLKQKEDLAKLRDNSAVSSQYSEQVKQVRKIFEEKANGKPAAASNGVTTV